MPGPAFGRVVTPQLVPVNKQRANVTPDKIAQDNAIERINGFLDLFSHKDPFHISPLFIVPGLEESYG